MATLPSPLDLLLHQRDRLMDDLAHGQNLARLWWSLVAVLVPAAGLYGVVLGGWHGGILAFFVALKLPLVLLLTSALTLPEVGKAIFLWLLLFALVSFQVSTWLRPVLQRAPGAPLFESEKMFFLEHLGKIANPPRPPKAEPAPAPTPKK